MYNYISIQFSEYKGMENKQIAELLRSVAAVYLLKGENQFRIIAYEKAADAVEQLNRELKDIWQEGRLNEVPGIGPSIGSHLDEYFKKGKSRHFDFVLSRVPKSVFILMKIATIGPKKAYKLVKELKLVNEKTAIKDLKKACISKKVEHLETFGVKSQSEILNSINLYERKSDMAQRMALPYAFSLAADLIKYLKMNKYILMVDALGSLRRMVTTIGDIDLAVKVRFPAYKSIVDHFLKYPKKMSVDNAGEKKASITVTPGIRIDLRIEPEAGYGAMLQYFTGNKAHNINLREFALKKGYSLSEYGIKDLKNKLHKFDNEKKFYNFLGLQYIPPELREGTNEIDLAGKNKIPVLVDTKDIKGDLHIHSSYDLKPSHDLGKDSYLDILKRAKKLRYEYVGFADHNPKISDLSEDKIVDILKKRKEHINNIKDDRIKQFIGLEVDIQPTGSIALPVEAMDYVDYLIVSVHSVFNLNVSAMTDRVLKALSFPKVKILGHPTGRLINKREGYQLEWTKIFEYCKKENIAIEINSWPERLDLPDTLVKDGLGFGVKYVINTDAHSVNQMDSIFYGISVARRGWCQKNDIINTLGYKKFKNWIFERR